MAPFDATVKNSPFGCRAPGSMGAELTLVLPPQAADSESLLRVLTLLRAKDFDPVVLIEDTSGRGVHGTKGDATLDVVLSASAVRITYTTGCYAVDD